MKIGFPTWRRATTKRAKLRLGTLENKASLPGFVFLFPNAAMTQETRRKPLTGSSAKPLDPIRCAQPEFCPANMHAFCMHVAD